MLRESQDIGEQLLSVSVGLSPANLVEIPCVSCGRHIGCKFRKLQPFVDNAYCLCF